jgi:long-chain acyl-CoA synthetase
MASREEMKGPFLWQKSWPPEIPRELAELPVASLGEMVDSACERYQRQLAFTACMPNGMFGHLTYSQVRSYSDAFARFLQGLPLQPGDRVAVQMPNCLSYPVAVFGCLKAGCVVVNTNPVYTAREMLHQFKDSGAKVIVIMDMFVDRLQEVLPETGIEHVVVVRIADFFPKATGAVIQLIQKYWNRTIPEIKIQHTTMASALEQGRRRAGEALPKVGPGDTAAIQYTGGTTGVSKGAVLTHRNLIANVYQVDALMGGKIEKGREVVLNALPLYHIFAFTVNLIGFFSFGCRNILIPNPRPLSNLKRAFENYRITWVPGVNTLFNGLQKELWFTEYPPRHLKAAIAGGMALHPQVKRAWEELVGAPLVEGYGLTEASPVLSFNPFFGSLKAGSIGVPLPSTEMRCVGESGAEVPQGESGEIVARGPQVMQGYWRRPEESSGVLKDGWLYTGDVGVMDGDGYFKIVDRKKDMIIVSGFKVYPSEVEEVLAEHPGVLEAGVIGVEDDRSGEAVEAYVVPAAGPISVAEIEEHCRKRLVNYKVPKTIVICDGLPKSPVGKILRKELRAARLEGK